MSDVLNLKEICKSFGGIHALSGIEFNLKKGEVHALLGENGAGKSTLIKILTGVIHPDSGKILLNGNEITVDDPIDARKKGIAAIYQELSLIESLSVAENIFLGNEPTKTVLGICEKKKLYEKSNEYLENFGINIKSNMQVSELGMGQKRIVEIVKALVIDAEILLLDEPTTGMSKVEIETLFKIMERLKEKNVTMIYISHYLDEIFKVCERATVLRDGKNVDTYTVADVTKDALISAMIGKAVGGFKGKETHDTRGKKTILKVSDFKTNIMKEPVSFCLVESEILGITGIVGAGKSEIAHSIFGNARIEQGSMEIGGQKVRFKTPHDTAKYKMAFVPEDRKTQGLFLEDSVADNITIVSIDKIKTKSGMLSKKKKEKLAYDMGKQLRISPLNTELITKNLSGGNQQKVAVAKWLAADPDIVLMDEPTRGIDVGAKQEIYQLISEIADKNKGVIIFSSEFEELIDLCDRILVVYKGKIVGEVSPKEATIEKLLSISLGG